MSSIEDVLRQFRPVAEPEGFWDRVVEGTRLDRESRPPRRWGWIRAIAAAVLFAFILALVTGNFGVGRTAVAPNLALEKIRRELEISRSACIRFTLESDSATGGGRRKNGVVFLKHGNKLNLSVREWPSAIDRGTPETEARLVSDGTRIERCLLRRGEQVEAQEMKPALVAPALADWYLRGGDLASWPAVVDVGLAEPIRDVKSVPGTPRAHGVSYTVGTLLVTLWYDPVTFKPLWRTFFRQGGESVTETYQEYEFNEDMSDSLFVLRKDK